MKDKQSSFELYLLNKLIESEKKNSETFIEISGVRVQTNNLKEAEELLDRIIEKHKNFIVWGREQKLKSGYIA